MLEVLNFTSATCGPCQIVKPLLSQLGKELKINVVEIDVKNFNNIDIKEKYDVFNIPTIIFLQDNIQKLKVIGADLPKIEEGFSLLAEIQSKNNKKKKNQIILPVTKEASVKL